MFAVILSIQIASMLVILLDQGRLAELFRALYIGIMLGVLAKRYT